MDHIVAWGKVLQGVDAARIGGDLANFPFGHIDLLVVVFVEVHGHLRVRNSAFTSVHDAVAVRIVEHEIADAAGVVEAEIVPGADLCGGDVQCPHGASAADKVHPGRQRGLDYIKQVAAGAQAAERIPTVCVRHPAGQEQISRIQSTVVVDVAVE